MESIKISLSQLQEEWHIYHFETIDSTHTYAVQNSEKLSLPCIIWADEQTHGRGRFDRKWESFQGNLMCSFVIKCPVEERRLFESPFWIAMSIYKSIFPILDNNGQLQLKWPNDILLNQKKIAGILIEKGCNNTLIIGIGINLISFAQNTSFPATSILEETGIRITTEQIIQPLASVILKDAQEWKNKEFSSIKNEWLSQVAFLSERIQVNLPHQKEIGIFQGVDDYGRLRLEQQDGAVKVISAADVFPL